MKYLIEYIASGTLEIEAANHGHAQQIAHARARSATDELHRGSMYAADIEVCPDWANPSGNVPTDSSHQACVSEDAINKAARYLAQEVLRMAWDGLRPDGRCTDGGWRPFGAGSHMNARQEDYRDAARGILRAAGIRLDSEPTA